MSESIHVTHCCDDQFDIAIRHHRFHVDQPVEDGGRDTAPTPTEMFVASLASCVAFYARRFLHRHGLSTEGLTVDAAYSMTTRPNRVGDISLLISVPGGVPEGRRKALLAVASHCTVHNSLLQSPDLHFDLSAPASSPIESELSGMTR